MISYIYLGIAVLLFVIGVFIKRKKVTWLISGYNTASKEEKETYDIDKLCYYMGNFVYILGFIWLVMTIFAFLMPDKIELNTYVGMGVQSVAMVLGIIYLNTNNRVKK